MKWVDHILENKIDDKQCGGGAGTSTTDALVEMIHHWCEATDRCGTYVRIVLLDFAKAFDLINHEKLLVKLKANDVPPHILRWMGSFLLDRTQQVKIGKTVSSVGNPNGGVPQGTVSGPRNVIMYINELTTIAPIYKYVDDSTLFEVCHEGDNTCIQESVDMVGLWTNQNDMRLNSEKCKEMIIDFSRNYSLTSGIRSVTIGEQVLERVEHAKMLGVTISNNLTWSKHVDNIVSKAGKRVYMLYQLKRAGISQLDLVKIYVSVIRPGAKTIKKNTNSTQNKFQTHRAKQYEVTSFLSTDCELSTETCSKNVYSLGPSTGIRMPGLEYKFAKVFIRCN